MSQTPAGSPTHAADLALRVADSVPHCKNMLDDGGTWTPIETYLRARTEAHFSHGLCPHCLEKHDPEMPRRED